MSVTCGHNTGSFLDVDAFYMLKQFTGGSMKKLNKIFLNHSKTYHILKMSVKAMSKENL